jgi:hypothetical protein
MKGYILDYINENEYRKLERALKKYNMLAYKKLNFDYYPSLRQGKFIGEVIYTDKKNDSIAYELKLPSDHWFSQVHGDIILHYIVYPKNNTVMLDTITTEDDILLEGHMAELPTYKGVMISKQNEAKDKFKIDLLDMLNK